MSQFYLRGKDVLQGGHHNKKGPSSGSHQKYLFNRQNMKHTSAGHDGMSRYQEEMIHQITHSQRTCQNLGQGHEFQFLISVFVFVKWQYETMLCEILSSSPTLSTKTSQVILSQSHSLRPTHFIGLLWGEKRRKKECHVMFTDLN